MTSFRQSKANRRNALRSTGPTSATANVGRGAIAFRQGLWAETGIEIVEVWGTTKVQAIIAEYDAQTAVERELMLRLASLLWRIRRATSIETDLMRVQALRDRGCPRFVGAASERALSDSCGRDPARSRKQHPRQLGR
jgi:hypothetical protein